MRLLVLNLMSKGESNESTLFWTRMTLLENFWSYSTVIAMVEC